MLLVHCKLLSETAVKATLQSDTPEMQLNSLVRALMDLYMSSRDKHVVLLNDTINSVLDFYHL